MNKNKLYRNHVFSHLMTKTKIYSTWRDMKRRCLNPNIRSFKNYGGRGIQVCEKWLKFEGFYEDMGFSWKEGLTLDRINVDGNYCKENCRWADRKQQAQNRRNSIWIIYKGKRKLNHEWAKIFNINPHTLQTRLKRNWPIKEALMLPLRKGKKINKKNII